MPIPQLVRDRRSVVTYPLSLPMGKAAVKQISLTKGEGILLEKTPRIVASVSWPRATDYDVYALVQYADGHVETVSTFGTQQNRRWSLVTSDGAVRHGGDVRRGRGGQRSAIGTESVTIDLHPGIVMVVPVVYSARSNGTGSFYRYRVSMRIDAGDRHVVIEAAKASRNNRIYTCVPGVIANGDSFLEVVALEQYSRPNSEHRPTIDVKHKVRMDTGPINVFK